MSILFHSIAAEGKKNFLKNSFLPMKEGTFSMHLVKYDLLDAGIILRRYLGDYLLKIL